MPSEPIKYACPSLSLTIIGSGNSFSFFLCLGIVASNRICQLQIEPVIYHERFVIKLYDEFCWLGFLLIGA